MEDPWTVPKCHLKAFLPRLPPQSGEPSDGLPDCIRNRASNLASLLPPYIQYLTTMCPKPERYTSQNTRSIITTKPSSKLQCVQSGSFYGTQVVRTPVELASQRKSSNASTTIHSGDPVRWKLEDLLVYMSIKLGLGQSTSLDIKR